jgi:hypothetical protein
MLGPASIPMLTERPRARTLIPVILSIAVGTASVWPVAAIAGQAVIQISAVLASKENPEFDPRLASIKPELRGLPFKGYTLLGIQSCRLEAGDHCAMDIPGGGYLHVTTTESTARHLKMRLLLNQGNRPILNADIKLNRDAGILLKSARTDAGVIILSIKSSSTPAATAARGAQ